MRGSLAKMSTQDKVLWLSSMVERVKKEDRDRSQQLITLLQMQACSKTSIKALVLTSCSLPLS